MNATPVIVESPSDNGGCVICGHEIRNRGRGAKTCLEHAHVRTRPRQRSKNRGKKSKETYFRRFVSIDGEATTKDGKYGLLATSSGAYIANRQGLSTEECLDFLLALPKYHTKGGGKPIYVGFAIDYDVNMILGDLPLFGEEGSIEQLRETGATHWRGYTIRYFRRKIFRVSRGKRTVTLYDTWGYFQSTFEAALSAWKIEVPSIITEGKAARGSFHRWSMAKLKEYNEAELTCHVNLMNQLRQAINPLELTVYSWHGPAGLAGYWMRKNNVTDYLAELPPAIMDVAGRAYFGGRIDIRGYGFVNPCYHYDIVSAYPSATRFLPDLSGIEWKYRKGQPPEDAEIYVAHCRWDIPPESVWWTPFPWRHTNGTIRYPYAGQGWYWHPEVRAAQARYPGCVEVVGYWKAEGNLSYPMKPLIEETFKYRAELKAAGNPSHVPVKLILNSIYGKFAQQIGKATYHNMVWAGLITSYTRAQMLSTMPEETVVVMTDSIWSAVPLDIPHGNELGGWEKQEENRLAVAEAGLYEAWIDGSHAGTWQRGFDKSRPVDISGIVRAWLDDPESSLYEPTYSVHRFVGMGLASIVPSYSWKEWRDIERTIHPVPLVGTTKRYPNKPNGYGVREGDFMSLFPRDADTGEVSAPYLKGTQDPALVQLRLEDECFDGDGE